MTQDKQLLLKDLCSRLPYGVKYRTIGSNFAFTLKWIDKLNRLDGDVRLENAKIFLRPMSSMTEEEQKEYHKTFRPEVYGNGFIYVESFRSFDWLNEHHFDYRGLIPKGLALSTEEFNPYENKD